MPPERTRLRAAIRTVALVEAAKGALVLLAGFGLLSLIHRDVQAIAERLVRHSHLNPASHYPRVFAELAGQITDGRLLLLAAGAAAYALLRFAEAWGLWRERPWAEWLAAASAGIYIPFEVIALFERGGAAPMAALAINVGIVALMLFSVMRGRADRA